MEKKKKRAEEIYKVGRRLRTQDSGLRTQGSGLRTQDSGLRAKSVRSITYNIRHLRKFHDLSDERR